MPTIGDLTAPGWLAGLTSRRRRGGRWRGGGRAAGAGAAAGGGRDAGELALDDDPAAIVLDLDLAEIVLVEHLGELLHQVGIDPHRPLRHLSLSLIGTPFSVAGRRLSETGGRVQSKLVAERAEAGDRSPRRRPRSASAGGSFRAPADWRDGPRSPARSIALTASCSATDVWLKPPALSSTALAPWPAPRAASRSDGPHGWTGACRSRGRAPSPCPRAGRQCRRACRTRRFPARAGPSRLRLGPLRT